MIRFYGVLAFTLIAMACMGLAYSQPGSSHQAVAVMQVTIPEHFSACSHSGAKAINQVEPDAVFVHGPFHSHFGKPIARGRFHLPEFDRFEWRSVSRHSKRETRGWASHEFFSDEYSL